MGEFRRELDDARDLAIRPAEVARIRQIFLATMHGDALEGFLERPAIYHHRRFPEEYEVQARANIVEALAQLAA